MCVLNALTELENIAIFHMKNPSPFPTTLSPQIPVCLDSVRNDEFNEPHSRYKHMHRVYSRIPDSAVYYTTYITGQL